MGILKAVVLFGENGEEETKRVPYWELWELSDVWIALNCAL
jgi:hypothetical protein